MSRKVRYTVVIPVYNEEAVVFETYNRITRIMRTVGEPYELLFVNDGSQDQTAEIIEVLAESDRCVRLLDFSRNFGHQIAITAGMDHARGDAIVVIDADLQDPPEIIPLMIDKWKQGYEVVYAKRTKRKGESWFKESTALLFYRLLRVLSDTDIPLDTGDFRLIDRKVCEVMRGIREKNRFIRGLISWAGFRQTAIEYVREERFAGETKYSLTKMLRLGMDGITSFSYKPLKLATYLGVTVLFTCFLVLVGALVLKLFNTAVVSGWTLVVASLLLLDGVILLFLGILGEYIGRIYDETKFRPLYILRNKPDEQCADRIEVEHRVH